MGSRKKIVKTPKSRSFIEAYKLLSLNDRIAFKAWAYWYGRQRFSLLDLIRKNYPASQLQWKNY